MYLKCCLCRSVTVVVVIHLSLNRLEAEVFLIVAGFLLISLSCMVDCLLCSDAVCWVAGRASSLQESEQWGAGVVISLERGVGLAFDPSV